MACHASRTESGSRCVAADPAAFRAHARNRGWNRLRVLSAGDSTPLIDGVAHRIPLAGNSRRKLGQGVGHFERMNGRWLTY